MGLKRTLEANSQFAESSKPCMRALNTPSMLVKAVVLLDASATYLGDDAALVQVLPTTREVVALVGVQFVRAASGMTTKARY
ncbi:hypothetical protein C266_22941 [Pandoraea sp. SD6-2]|nr:hypothetical protein C266_22941 [Pandoraea sp. SD6-2]